MKIKELYTDKSKWTQGVSYRDIYGIQVIFDYPPYSFCLLGAIYYCYNSTQYDKIIDKIRDKIRDKIVTINAIVEWNDAPERTFEEVKQLVEELDI